MPYYVYSRSVVYIPVPAEKGRLRKWSKPRLVGRNSCRCPRLSVEADAETQTERDRETERQGDRETERQRYTDRERRRQRNTDRETQRRRER